jgi:hypothetical protein
LSKQLYVWSQASIFRRRTPLTWMIQKCCGVYGAGPVETDYFEGRHRISGQRAYDFLAEQL